MIFFYVLMFVLYTNSPLFVSVSYIQIQFHQVTTFHSLPWKTTAQHPPKQSANTFGISQVVTITLVTKTPVLDKAKCLQPFQISTLPTNTTMPLLEFSTRRNHSAIAAASRSVCRSSQKECQVCLQRISPLPSLQTQGHPRDQYRLLVSIMSCHDLSIWTSSDIPLR